MIRRGSILIIALWSLCILSIFAVYLGYSVRQKISLIQRLDERAQLRFIVEAGVKKGIVQIRKEPLKDYDTPRDAWSNDASAFQDVDIGNGRFNVSYDYIDEASGLSEIRYGLVDEERKININKSELSVLMRLFQITLNFSDTEAQELAASIIDWRDKDSQLTMSFNDAEDSYYRTLTYPYEAKDADFEVLEEALLVKGMTEDIFKKIKDYITIYGSGRININTAPRVILLALGLSEDIVNKIISFRVGQDAIIGTADDRFFDNPPNIVPYLSQAYQLSPSQISETSRVVEQNLVTNSNNFMIKSKAKLHNRNNTAEAVCIVNRKGKVLYWRES